MKATKYTIGLDLGDRSHAYCVLDENGKIMEEDKIANTREALEALSKIPAPSAGY
jgi:predicted NBD/HSP70 family sugar kinase